MILICWAPKPEFIILFYVDTEIYITVNKNLHLSKIFLFFQLIISGNSHWSLLAKGRFLGLVMRSVLAGQLIRVKSKSVPRSYCTLLPPSLPTFPHNDGLMDYFVFLSQVECLSNFIFGLSGWFMNKFPPLKYHYFQFFQFHWYGWWRRFLITRAHSERER